jgi:uncharacterized membrane protein YjjB (DUF3815 family)
MDIKRVVFEFFVCTAATVFFSLLMNAPPKTVPFSALIGGVSWTVYRFMLVYSKPEYAAYFVGTLIVAVAAEVLARIFKMPAPIFILPSLIPIVPGTRLYRTALALVEEDYTLFRDEAARTLFAFCAISVAIAITSVAARSFSAYISTRARNRRQKHLKKEPG